MSWPPRARRRLRRALHVAAILLVAAVFAGPILWIIATAFKAPRDVYALRGCFGMQVERGLGGHGGL